MRVLAESKRNLGLKMKLLETELKMRKAKAKNADRMATATERDANQKRLLQLEITLLEHQIAMKVMDGKLAQALAGQQQQQQAPTVTPQPAQEAVKRFSVPVAKQPHSPQQQSSSSFSTIPNHRQAPPPDNNYRPMRGRRRARHVNSKLAMILNRLEANIQKNESRGENNADRFIANMVSNPQVRGRALIANTHHHKHAMIHTE